MIRTQLRQKNRIRASKVSVQQSYPPPVGGWNARDALAAMKPTDAVALDNLGLVNVEAVERDELPQPV